MENLGLQSLKQYQSADRYNADTAHRFVEEWTAHMTAWLMAPVKPSRLLLDYRDLEDSPTSFLNSIKEFVDLDDLDATVLQIRQNTRDNETATYRPPASLDDWEIDSTRRAQACIDAVMASR